MYNRLHPQHAASSLEPNHKRLQSRSFVDEADSTTQSPSVPENPSHSNFNFCNLSIFQIDKAIGQKTKPLISQGTADSETLQCSPISDAVEKVWTITSSQQAVWAKNLQSSPTPSHFSIATAYEVAAKTKGLKTLDKRWDAAEFKRLLEKKLKEVPAKDRDVVEKEAIAAVKVNPSVAGNRCQILQGSLIAAMNAMAQVFANRA